MVTPSMAHRPQNKSKSALTWHPFPSGEEASRAAGIRRARPELGYPDTAFPCPVQQALQ